MPLTETDLKHLKRTLELAKAGVGYVSPNPLVGCVIVNEEGKVIGEGAHLLFGNAHAEVNAILDAESKGHSVQGATLYVNLEPCNHTGKTPPCSELIVRKGIARVVAAMEDPNPRTSGKGVKRLREANIRVDIGVLENEARWLNRFFIKHIKTGRPYVTLKIAATIDGQTRTGSSESRWITSPESRKVVHAMRAEYDAVLVGWNTAKQDDPELTVRDAVGRNPFRILLDSKLASASHALKLLHDGHVDRTIVVTSEETLADNPKAGHSIESSGARLIVVPRRARGLDLEILFDLLGSIDIGSVLVEPGERLATSLLEADLVDEIVFFFAPNLLGTDTQGSIGTMGSRLLNRAPSLKLMETSKIEGSDDLCVRYVRAI
jgi:diaminohydroxyphosphoribosylaminopyrimidine deaminase/5-amino-6-(5-phosphoribosylamino)uracil reductase